MPLFFLLHQGRNSLSDRRGRTFSSDYTDIGLGILNILSFNFPLELCTKLKHVQIELQHMKK